MLRRWRLWLQISRPGLWFVTLWLYLLPVGGWPARVTPAFLAGLAFVTFPLGLLVYGWNDRVDAGADRQNPRKGSWLFGAQADDGTLDHLPRVMALVTALGFAPLVLLDGPRQLLVLAGIVAVCALYNREPGGWRGRPPLELLCQIGYLLVVPLSAWLNDVPPPPLATWLYLWLFTLQAQLMGEVMDVTPDRAAGRRTTATTLGVRRTKLLVMALVAAEALLLALRFREPVFAGALGLFFVWLVLDRFVVFGGRDYTLTQLRVFGVGSNLMAVASMAWVGWTGCLLR